MQTLFKVDAIDTEPAIRNQKSNFTCREDTHTQVMPEVQAMPKQTAALPKFTWLSTLESKCKVRSKVFSLSDPNVNPSHILMHTLT